jgi:hypothetical protein
VTRGARYRRIPFEIDVRWVVVESIVIALAESVSVPGHRNSD